MMFLIDNAFLKSAHNANLTNLIKEAGYQFRVVKLIPFSNGEYTVDDEYHPGLTNEILHLELGSRKDVFIWGRSSLKALGIKHGWIPGYYDDKLDMRELFNMYPGYCLNEKSIITEIKHLIAFHNEGTYHIRPVSDDKVFAGSISSPASIRHWAKSVVALSNSEDYSTVDENTLVVVSPYQSIHAEYRLHIVEGHIITGSQYAKDGRLHVEAGVPDTIIQFVETLLRINQPNDAFVMDVAQLHNGALKVIEFNAISGSGLYLSDQPSLIGAIAAWTTKLQRQ